MNGDDYPARLGKAQGIIQCMLSPSSEINIAIHYLETFEGEHFSKEAVIRWLNRAKETLQRGLD